MKKELLKKLLSLGVNLKVDEGNLKINAPKGILNEALLNEIKLNKTYLINLLSSKIQIPKAKIQESYPVSSSQRRLWMLSKFEGGNNAYNISNELIFNGVFDKDKFSQVFNILLERHESLRTFFKENEDGELRQFIIPSEEINFMVPFHEESNSISVKRDVVLEKHRSHTFDLTKAPLFNVEVLKNSETEHVLLFNLHHIVGDGWSLEVLSREVIQIYNTLLNGKQPRLERLPIQYKDFCVWSENSEQREKLKSSEAYWLGKLSGNPTTVDLPGSKRRPKIKTYNGTAFNYRFSKAFTNSFKEFVKEEGVSLFMGLMAGINGLLYRYTHRTDFVVGTAVAGREHQDLTNQIGLYINTLAIRTEFNDTISFKELLEIQKVTLIDAYKHQSYPFDVLLDQLDVKRDVSRSALFDMMVVLQNQQNIFASDTTSFEEISVKPYEGSEKSTSQFDISLSFVEKEDTIDVAITYNTDIYTEFFVKRFVEHLECLIKNAMGNPELPLKHIDYLSFSEKKGLLHQKNETPINYPKDKNILDVFEEQVFKFPDNIAVVFDDREITYYELDILSNQFAHFLKDVHNVRSEDLIGMLLPRSEWMLIVILGILKSGGAYVPVDPNYPQNRIDYIIEDSKCKICIDQEVLDSFIKQQDTFSKERGAQEIRPNNLAYVIYTSGTTGNPKGVLLEHANVVRLFYHDNQLFDFDSKDVWCLFHSYCFDFSVWEIFGALLFGGKLVVIPESSVKDTFLFAKILEKEKVTILNQTPSAFKLLQSRVAYSNIPLDIRYVIFGGEALYPYLLKEWKEMFPSCKLINMYGITETTVHVTYKEVNDNDIRSNVSNIGSPIPTLECYILDDELQLVPNEVAGELYVSGAGLARGYLNLPQLTEEKFIANPYKKGEKLYKTGDLGKWLVDGSMEYLGRIDSQVKIRGHRIELKEIEYQLQRKESIKEVVAMAIGANGEDKQLVTYFVSDIEEKKQDLRSFLATALPGYMQPTAFVQLEAFPLTSNGKIDKKSFPKPEEANVSNNLEYRPPTNDMEKKLVEIWKDVLKKERIGIEDNFFELGGHSLNAVRIVSKIERNFKIRVDLNSFYDNPTISYISSFIASIQLIGEQEKEMGQKEGEALYF